MRKITFALGLIATLLTATIVSPKDANAQACRDILAKPEHTFGLTKADFEPFTANNRSKLLYDFKTVSNEFRQDLFARAHKDGGGYVGVGGDQNFTQILLGHHKMAWIYDMDPRVIGTHLVMKRAFETEKSPEEFITFFKDLENKDHTQTSISMILEITHDIELSKVLVEMIQNSNLSTYFTGVAASKTDSGQAYTFLGNTQNYNTIRELSLGRKIRILQGNHMNPSLFAGIATEAKAAGLSIESINLSNSLEPRWMFDRTDQASNFFGGMLFGLAAADRFSIENVITKVNALIPAIRNLMNSPESKIRDQKLETAFRSLKNHFQILPYHTAGLKLVQENWNKLSDNLSSLPLGKESTVLSTVTTPFNIMDLRANEFTIWGKSDQVVGGAILSWTYCSMQAPQFVSLMKQRLESHVTRIDQLVDGYTKQLNDLVAEGQAKGLTEIMSRALTD